jgi:hypothetical protein
MSVTGGIMSEGKKKREANEGSPTWVKNRKKLLAFFSNPDAPKLPRSAWSTKILGYKNEVQIYKFFSPYDLNEIEWEALEMRRKRYASKMTEVDRAMIKEASSGNAKAAELCYKKFEGMTDKKEIDLKAQIKIEVIDSVPDEKN